LEGKQKLQIKIDIRVSIDVIVRVVIKLKLYCVTSNIRVTVNVIVCGTC